MSIRTTSSTTLTMLAKGSVKPVPLPLRSISLDPDDLRLGAYAFDLETEGLDWLDDSRDIQLIAVANATTTHVFDYKRMNTAQRHKLLLRLSQCDLTAWNLMFDAGWLGRECRRYGVAEPKWLGCSLLLYKLLTTETPNFSWALASAQELLLGWGADAQKSWLTDALRAHKLTKDRMWELYDAVPEQYATYASMDAQACWHIWQHCHTSQHIASILPWFAAHMQLLWLLLEQQRRGIKIDTTAMRKYRAALDTTAVQYAGDFLAHPDVKAYVKSLRDAARTALLAAEPPKLTKTGKVAKRWESWDAKVRQVATADVFNINSGPQLKDLFYSWLGFIPTRHTDAGVPQLDKNQLPNLGEPGKLLSQYRKTLKEAQYVTAALDKITKSNEIHPRFKIHGTITGRLGGDGGLNLQQQPKTKGYLQCWQARPGYKLVQLDYTALEPVVLTEASRDASLRQIYAPGMPPNDIYLFVGAHIPAFAKHIRRWYDPANPTAEGIKLAKKHAKRERGICKTVHLAKQYGAGAHKIWATLREAGEQVELTEIMEVSNAWNQLFAGVREFGQRLTAQWGHNKGWIVNGLGRPMAVGEDLIKDITNRYCQSTGHDFLVWHLTLIANKRGNLRMYPWIVDFHDEMIWEVHEADVPAARQLILDTLQELNETVPWEIKIQGDVQIANTLADIKVEG